MRVLWAVSRLKAVLGAPLIGSVIAATPFAHHYERTSNPFAGAKFFVDPGSNASRAVRDLDSRGRHDDARLIEKTAGHSTATWFGGWSSGADIKERVAEIAADGSLPVLVATTSRTGTAACTRPVAPRALRPTSAGFAA